jgi:hydrogenase expression/formation protein HypC
MCLAIPMRITAIDGKMATVELDGLSQRASLMLLPSASVGDYVLVHAGCAIAVLSEEDAQETYDLLNEIAAFGAESSETEPDD